jgi:hypothetical protein
MRVYTMIKGYEVIRKKDGQLNPKALWFGACPNGSSVRPRLWIQGHLLLDCAMFSREEIVGRYSMSGYIKIVTANVTLASFYCTSAKLMIRTSHQDHTQRELTGTHRSRQWVQDWKGCQQGSRYLKDIKTYAMPPCRWGLIWQWSRKA